MPNKKFSKDEIRSALEALFKGQKIVEYSFELIEKCLSEIVPATEVDEVTLHQLFFTPPQNPDSALVRLQEVIMRSEQHFLSIFGSKMRAAHTLRQLIEHANFRISNAIDQRSFISEILKVFEYFNASNVDDHAVANFIKDQPLSELTEIRPGSLTARVAKLMQTHFHYDSYNPAIPETKNNLAILPTILPVNKIKVEQQKIAALSIPDQKFSIIEKNELVELLKQVAALQERAENLQFQNSDGISFLKNKKLQSKKKRLEQIYEKSEKHMARIMELLNSITIFETDILHHFNDNCKISEILLLAFKNRPKPLFPIKAIIVSPFSPFNIMHDWDLFLDNIIALANIPHSQITSITFAFDELGMLPLPQEFLQRFTDEVSNFKTLTDLTFRGVSPEGNQLLLSRIIETCPSLISVIIEGGEFLFNRQELTALAEVIRNKDTFSTLILDARHFGGNDLLNLISVYQEHRNFNVFRLSGNYIGEQMAITLAQAMQRKFAKTQSLLKVLDLRNSGITINGLGAISNVLKDNIIWYLNLSQNNLSPASTYKFLNFFRRTPQDFQLFLNSVNSSNVLERLNLSCSKLSLVQIKILAQALAENTSLEILDLAENNIGNEGLQLIANALKKNKTLRKLNLECNQINDKGILCLCEALIENKTLIEINLNQNNLGDTGALVISQVLPLLSLRTLYLNSCGILSEGVEHLAISMRQKTSTLTHISVTGYRIDNAAAEAVLQTVTDPKIRSFKIEITEISPRETKIALRSSALTNPYCLALSYFGANKMAMPAVTKHWLNEFLIPPLIKIIIEYTITPRDDAAPDYSNSAFYCLESTILWWLDTHKSDDNENVWTMERTKDFTSGNLISSYLGNNTNKM
jgi:Ran GTPase-activating protein (RanGAP) involved in mRNA processing and transport